MYDVDKLERDWIKYKRKKSLLPLVGLLVIVLILIVVVYMKFFYISSSNQKASKNNPNLKQNKIPASQDYNKQTSNKTGHNAINFNDSSTKTNTHERKKIKIVITERKKGSNIAQDIESRYKSSPNTNDSMFLAKYYYDRGDYAKAEKWAYETSKLDSNIEDSWLIFAKAQAKQGKRLEALKILKIFYDKSGSQKARNLIDNIRRGKKY